MPEETKSLKERVEHRLKTGALFCDSGCDCTGGRPTLNPRAWGDLDFYLNPEHGHVSKLEAFANGEKTNA